MWSKSTRADIQDLFDNLVTPEIADLTIKLLPGREYMCTYMRSYRKTPEGRAACRKYEASEKGQARKQAHKARRGQVVTVPSIST